MVTVDPDKIESLRGQGLSQVQIANAVGVSRSSVQRVLSAKGHRDNRTPVPASGAIPTFVGKTNKHARGRETMTSPNSTPIFTGKGITEQPPDLFRDWTILLQSGLNIANLAGTDINNALLRLSPEYSRAVWDWLRMLDPGHEINAMKVGQDDTPDKEAQAVLDEFMGVVDERHGSRAVLFSEFCMNAITRGAFFGELILDDIGRTPLDIVAPDPTIVRFQKTTDGPYGEVYEIGQIRDGKFETLDYPTVRYLPVDPEPGSPYGRPMFSSAVFPALFIIGLFSDLRRVIANQGYPRGEVKINVEKLRLAYPDMKSDDFNAVIENLIGQVQRILSTLDVDEDFIHVDMYEYGTASGAIDATSLGGAGPVTEAVERMMIRAMKTMPLMMGVTDGVSEANANRQWEIFAAGIKALQHHMEQLLEQLLTLAMETLGIQTKVVVRFAELRAAEAQRDAETDLRKMFVAEKGELLGYMSRDEASLYAVGHKAAEAEKPADATAPTHAPELPQPVDNVTATAQGQTRAASASVSQQDLKDAVAAWNVALPNWAGLLEAEVDDGNPA